MLALGLAFSAIGYLATLRTIARAPANTHLSVIFVAAALAEAAALCSPVVFSSDVYAYAAYGDLALHGANPYRHVALIVNDDVLRAAVWQWGNPPPMCVYGPLFVALTNWVVALGAPLGAAWTLMLLRIVACLGLLASGGLTAQLLGGWPAPRRNAAVAAVVLNPVALWAAAEGHNDTLMLCAALGGLALARRYSLTIGAFAIGLCGLVKLPGIAAFVALRRTSMRAVAPFLAGLLASALVALPFERGVGETLVPHGHYQPQYSLQALMPGTSGIAAALACCALIASAGFLMLRSRRREGFVALATALWLAIPNPYPWYALWILPVAAIALDAPAGPSLLAATLSITLRYLPDAWGTLDRDAGSALTWVELGPAFLAAWVSLTFTRRGLAARTE
jgi:hypothetical protein